MPRTESPPASPSVDPAELEKFAAMADDWWDPEGKFKPLHQLAPVRLGFIKDEACRHFGRKPGAAKPLKGLKLLDIGCGGGLLTEPMARLGAEASGLDAEAANIEVAKTHAQGMRLDIDYRAATAEDLVAAGEAGRFDIVLAMEVLEHVADIDSFTRAATTLLKPDGLVVASTINRTPKAFALAVVGAEYILRWLPRGTHDWRKFLKPSELARTLRACGFEMATLAPGDRIRIGKQVLELRFGDPSSVEEEADTLLAAADEPRGTTAPSSTPAAFKTREAIRSLGPYTILTKCGEGGMGTSPATVAASLAASHSRARA